MADSATDEIRNFLLIDSGHAPAPGQAGAARIATGGQPTPAQIQQIAAAGYRAVINLGLLDPKYCLADEAGLVAGLGLDYHHIPVKFDAPSAEDFAAFVAVMDQLATQPVFVHCAANYRVTSFMALYGELRLGWSRQRADAHARTWWQPNDVWQDFLQTVRTQFMAARPNPPPSPSSDR